MLISYHGHSEFLLESQRGFSILTDPYDAHVGYPMENFWVDAVTVSHAHGDHSFIEKAEGECAIVNEAGVWQIAPEVQVTAIPSFHDDARGEKRGGNLIMKIEMDDLVLAHLGDLGVLPDAAQQAALGKVDVLFLPVGGFYTIGPREARETVDLIRPRIVIPMHYKTEVNQDWPIAGAEEFLALMGEEKSAPMPLIRIARGDLSQQPTLALLDHRAD